MLEMNNKLSAGQKTSAVINIVLCALATLTFIFCVSCAIEMIQLSQLDERDLEEGLSFAFLIVFYFIGMLVSFVFSLPSAIWTGVVGFSKRKPIANGKVWLFRVPFILNVVYIGALIVLTVVVLIIPKG